MNILPKKRWHVRTKDNIARVRRDEALAAEEEKKKEQRLEKAEREARTEALRKKAREQYGVHCVNNLPSKSTDIHDTLPCKHVNLFYELEQNEIVSDRTNEEHEKEKKLEKEQYEKQIGYLTYLGQDTNEITGKVSWYNLPRKEMLNDREEVSKKHKEFEDPLVNIKKYLNSDTFKNIVDYATPKKETVKRNNSESSKKHKKNKKEKHKKKRKHKSKFDSDLEVVVTNEAKHDLQKLRAERLQRERNERRRALEVFGRLNGTIPPVKEEPVPQVSQKYNSQFNPHLAKQNYSN